MEVDLAKRVPLRLTLDRSRVVTRLFVPGQEGFEQQDSRAGAVLARILALSEDEVMRSLDDVISRFDSRHRDLGGTFRRHARELADRLRPDARVSDARMLLLGATFSSEYAIEGAALCNPSMVAHPDQAGMVAGELRILLSVRGIGEGHRSSIGFFRTGVVDATGSPPHIDPVGAFATLGATAPGGLDAAVFSAASSTSSAMTGTRPTMSWNHSGECFTRTDLEERLVQLQSHSSTRGRVLETISEIRAIADRSYAVEFLDQVPISERVLWPATHAESVGMEDARFVRFVNVDGSVTFYATYTAYSGSRISNSCWRRPTSGRSPRSPWLGALRPTRVWHCFRVASTAGTPGCRGRIASRTRSRIRITHSCGLTRARASARSRPGRSCNWATVVHRSRPTPVGWCSPMGSARCAPTG